MSYYYNKFEFTFFFLSLMPLRLTSSGHFITHSSIKLLGKQGSLESDHVGPDAPSKLDNGDSGAVLLLVLP
jgi:hypothetical protein